MTVGRPEAALLARFLDGSRAVHYLAAAPDGAVTACNAAMAAALKAAPADVVGRPLGGLLPEADAALRRRLGLPGRGPGERFLLNFVDAAHCPFTLECLCEAGPGGLQILGEPPGDAGLCEELLRVNNQLAVLGREHARRGKELEEARALLEVALRELEGSYWHLKKAQEVLPLCMGCGQVKGGAGWQGVLEYLKQNARFLSHGYCPACLAKEAAKWGLPGGEGRQ